MTLSMFRMSVCEKPRGEGDLLLTTMHAANRAIAKAPNELDAPRRSLAHFVYRLYLRVDAPRRSPRIPRATRVPSLTL